jgi:hypothetical protein
MRLFTVLLLLASLFGSIHQVMADFVISQVDTSELTIYYEACPANQNNCNCLWNGTFGASVNLLGAQNIFDTNSFRVDVGLCSKGLMDFYLQQSGVDWQFYDHDGDGTLLGTCSQEPDLGDCPFTFTIMTCTSSVCGT